MSCVSALRSGQAFTPVSDRIYVTSGLICIYSFQRLHYSRSYYYYSLLMTLSVACYSMLRSLRDLQAIERPGWLSDFPSG